MPGTYRPPTAEQAENARRTNDDIIQGEVIDPDDRPKDQPKDQPKP